MVTLNAMRRTLLLVMALSACGPAATAPTPSLALATPTTAPTATARPTATLPPSPTPTVSPAPRASSAVHYVAIGASDTVGVGSLDPATGSWPSRIAALLPQGSTYRNLGVSGSLAAQARAEQLPTAVAEQPTAVTIWLAVNDLDAEVAPADHAAAIDAILADLTRATSARVFIGNVPDLRAVPAYAGADQVALGAIVTAYNQGIAAAAAKHPGRVRVVDLFTGSAELTTQLTVAPDGFHPSDAGYVLIAQRFAAAMREEGIPLRPGP